MPLVEAVRVAGFMPPLTAPQSIKKQSNEQQRFWALPVVGKTTPLLRNDLKTSQCCFSGHFIGKMMNHG